jgi:hypothetical protein
MRGLSPTFLLVGVLTVAALVWGAAALADGQVMPMLIAGVLALVLVWTWWRSRRGNDR